MRILPVLAAFLIATGLAGCNADVATQPVASEAPTGGASATAPTITSSAQLPSGTVGMAYSVTLSASGGAAPYSWRVAAGSLPAGLLLNQNTGVISGVPTVATSASVTIAVSDANATSSSMALSVQTLPAGLAITTSLQLPTGVVGNTYSFTLAASGGTAPYSWQVTSGSLPAGLSLNATTGVISGTPSAPISTTPTITVTDANAATASAGLTLQIFAPGLAITSGAQLPNSVVGTAFSATLAATGGIPPYRWQVTAGALPAGLSLDPASGVVSGTPTAAGSATPTVTVTDSVSTTASLALSMQVVPTPLAISTASSLPNANVGSAYSVSLSATGGTTPYRWQIVSGSLPAGLSLNATGGVISGTPTTAVNASLVLSVTDSNSASANASFSLRVIPPPVTVTTGTQLPGGTVGVAYSTTLAASGGTTPYRWQVTAGALPAGLTLNSTTGVISGTPTSAVTATPTITVTDASSSTASAGFNLRVVAASISISSATTLPNGTVGTAYSSTLAATGGTTPYTWSVTSGALPAGLTLNSTTGVISGTPTAAVNATPTITVTDSASASISAAFTLRVTAPALGISTGAQLPGGTVSTAYTTTLAATGGSQPYSWSVTSGALPAGLTLNTSTGAISGTPTTAGSASFTVSVTDASSTSAATSFSLTVAAATTGWTLVWSDEFNGTSIDGSKWLNPTNDNSCGALVKSTAAGDDAYLDGNGNLVLRAQSRASGGCGTQHITFGQVSTKGRFSQAYGRFEFRAQMPDGGSGSWPALWLYPIGVSWPPEIDVLEMQADPNTAYMTYHWGTEANHQQSFASANVPGLSTGFHTFAVEWDPGSITWYIDGNPMRSTFMGPDVTSTPMGIIMGMQIGDWTGAGISPTLPKYLIVDYVRVYKRN